jgi:predicted N-acetyltransferase YhbS
MIGRYDRRVLPAIRPMRPADVELSAELILRNDFGVRREWLAFATSQPECHPIVATADGDVVGTGVGTANGPVGWIGTIFIAPEQRGRGVGTAITQALVDALEGAGCETLVLVSTREGLPLYRRLGFKAQARYQILEADGLAGPADPLVRAYRPADLAAMLTLDREATGEDRGHALRRFADPASSKVVTDVDDVIRGFVVRAPWGGGATIAPDVEDALRILQARRAASGPGGRVRVGLLDLNGPGLARMAAEGLRPAWSAPRLARGRPLDWHPEWIWGQLNHAIG